MISEPLPQAISQLKLRYAFRQYNPPIISCMESTTDKQTMVIDDEELFYSHFTNQEKQQYRCVIVNNVEGHEIYLLAIDNKFISNHSGAVTYCAAINEGERKVTKAIREAGYPLVVMMLDGFPPEGSEAARFFHPGGAYHKVCGEGRLYLMAPLSENYSDTRLIERTEAELKRKAEHKGMRYDVIPRESKRWRMIAGNEMLKMIINCDNEI